MAGLQEAKGKTEQIHRHRDSLARSLKNRRNGWSLVHATIKCLDFTDAFTDEENSIHSPNFNFSMSLYGKIHCTEHWSYNKCPWRGSHNELGSIKETFSNQNHYAQWKKYLIMASGNSSSWRVMITLHDEMVQVHHSEVIYKSSY